MPPLVPRAHMPLLRTALALAAANRQALQGCTQRLQAQPIPGVQASVGASPLAVPPQSPPTPLIKPPLSPGTVVAQPSSARVADRPGSSERPPPHPQPSPRVLGAFSASPSASPSDLFGYWMSEARKVQQQQPPPVPLTPPVSTALSAGAVLSERRSAARADYPPTKPRTTPDQARLPSVPLCAASDRLSTHTGYSE